MAFEHVLLDRRSSNPVVALVTLCVFLPTVLGARQTSQAVYQPDVERSQAIQRTPSFQIVSIQRSSTNCPAFSLNGRCVPSADAPSMSVQPGGRFEARRYTIEDLARVAYSFEDVDPRETVRKPWFFPIGRQTFDVTAVTDREWTRPPPGENVPAELRPMLRALLSERFSLRARIEDRNVDVYALRFARPDHAPGPGLRESISDCLGPYTPAPIGEVVVERCPFRLETNLVQAGAITMSDLARLIPRINGSRIDRIIVDHTGLEGTYDVLLTIGLGLAMPAAHGDRSSLDQLALDAQPSALLADRRPIAVRDALQNQLGLRLVKAKLPIPVLVIENADGPIVE